MEMRGISCRQARGCSRRRYEGATVVLATWWWLGWVKKKRTGDGEMREKWQRSFRVEGERKEHMREI